VEAKKEKNSETSGKETTTTLFELGGYRRYDLDDLLGEYPEATNEEEGPVG